MEWTTFLCNIISKMKGILLTSQSNMAIESQTRSLTEEQKSVKNGIRKSSVGPKDTITNIYREAGGYPAARSCSDFPRNCKQISNIGNSEKTQTLKDDITEVIDMCKMEKNGSNFIRNTYVAPEKIIYLMTNCWLNDMKRFCTSNIEVPILGIDPTYNIDPCFVTISTYWHLQFLTHDNVHPVILGPLFTQIKIINHIFCFQVRFFA